MKCECVLGKPVSDGGWRLVMVGVSGVRPGLVDQLPGEPGWVKRRGVRAWVIGAGWWRLTRAGESGRGAWWWSWGSGGWAPVR
jgi:hypothetical protein